MYRHHALFPGLASVLLAAITTVSCVGSGQAGSRGEVVDGFKAFFGPLAAPRPRGNCPSTFPGNGN